MSINPTTQLVILIYEYLYNRGCRMELEYHKALDYHYRDMFQRQPEKYITSEELVKLIEKRAQFEEFQIVQKELIKLLDLYKPGSVNNPDNY